VTAAGKVSAKEMLRFARKSMLTQIEVGYSSLGTFSQTFHEIMRESPHGRRR
jgi:transcriptional regulator GlxA family with amidase domain